MIRINGFFSTSFTPPTPLQNSLSLKSLETFSKRSKPMRNGEVFSSTFGREVHAWLKIWSQIGLKRLGDSRKLETQRDAICKGFTLELVTGDSFRLRKKEVLSLS
jgi:hypothetical protein